MIRDLWLKKIPEEKSSGRSPPLFSGYFIFLQVPKRDGKTQNDYLIPCQVVNLVSRLGKLVSRLGNVLKFTTQK